MYRDGWKFRQINNPNDKPRLFKDELSASTVSVVTIVEEGGRLEMRNTQKVPPYR